MKTGFYLVFYKRNNSCLLLLSSNSLTSAIKSEYSSTKLTNIRINVKFYKL